MSDSAKAIDRAFYELTVKERDLERTRAQRLERERDECRRRLVRALVQTGELGVGAMLAAGYPKEAGV